MAEDDDEDATLPLSFAARFALRNDAPDGGCFPAVLSNAHEVARARAHVRLWRSSIGGQEPMLIAESGARPPPVGLVRTADADVTVVSYDGASVGPRLSYYPSLGYIVWSAAAARRLAERAVPLAVPVDVLLLVLSANGDLRLVVHGPPVAGDPARQPRMLSVNAKQFIPDVSLATMLLCLALLGVIVVGYVRRRT